MFGQDNSIDFSQNLYRAMVQNQNENIKKIQANFSKAVQKPIQIRETLMKNGESQRCLQHNIMYSVYCTICRKPLCASCMYSSNAHRKHRVKPLETALDQVKEDIKTFQAKIPKIIQQCQGLINSNRSFLIGLQRQFTPLVAKLEEFYEQLHRQLKAMKKHQVNALMQKQQAVRREVGEYNRELSKISLFVLEKYKSYTKHPQKVSLTIPSRVILENLLAAGQFVKTPLIDLDKYSCQLTEAHIKKTHEDIMYKLAGLLIKFETKIDSSRIKPRPKSLKPIKNVSTNDVHLLNKRKDKELFEKRRNNSSVAGARTRY